MTDLLQLATITNCSNHSVFEVGNNKRQNLEHKSMSCTWE